MRTARMLLVVAVALAAGCGPQPGEVGAECLPNGKCNVGLSCISMKCLDLVAADVTAGAKADGTPATGGAGSGSAAAATAAPPATAAPIAPPDDGTFDLAVTPEGLTLEGGAVTTEELGTAIAAAAAAKPDTTVIVHVDSAVPYLRVTSIFDLVKRRGLKKVALAPAGTATPAPAPLPGQMNVTLTAKGYLLDGRKVTPDALGAAVEKAAATDRATPVRLTAGADVPYDVIVDAIDFISTKGLGKVSFAVAPAAK